MYSLGMFAWPQRHRWYHSRRRSNNHSQHVYCHSSCFFNETTVVAVVISLFLSFFLLSSRPSHLYAAAAFSSVATSDWTRLEQDHHFFKRRCHRCALFAFRCYVSITLVFFRLFLVPLNLGFGPFKLLKMSKILMIIIKCSINHFPSSQHVHCGERCLLKGKLEWSSFDSYEFLTYWRHLRKKMEQNTQVLL